MGLGNTYTALSITLGLSVLAIIAWVVFSAPAGGTRGPDTEYMKCVELVLSATGNIADANIMCSDLKNNRR